MNILWPGTVSTVFKFKQRRGTSAYLKPAVCFFPLRMDQTNRQYDVRHQPDRWENCTILTVGMQRSYWWISNVDVCQARIVGFVFSFSFDNQADVTTSFCHICLEHIHSIIPTNQGILDFGCMQVRLNLIWVFHFDILHFFMLAAWYSLVSFTVSYLLLSFRYSPAFLSALPHS